MPDPEAMVDAVSLEADEDLNTGSRYLDVSEKCAQRGINVSLVQLKSLMEKLPGRIRNRLGATELTARS